ncbi:MAG: glycoside hydrolase family 113, partial [Tepidisphaeraceae bacterium]
MMHRFVIIFAVVLYACAAGFALLTTESSPAGAASAVATNDDAPAIQRSLAGLPYCAISIQIQRPDWIERYKQCIDEIASVGADTVKLVVDARQENGKSCRIYLDLRMTPTPEQLIELVRHAKSRNLRVILMPIVLLDAPVGNDWRGTIHPDSWREWWESYRAMLSHFAWIAQTSGVDVFVVGSELVSTEDKPAEWKETIAMVRATFKGRLTYSSNWDHYTAVPFWDQLDLIGMNSYWIMGDNERVTVDEIKGRWK